MTDFLSAIQGGANAGMQMRQIGDQEQQQAAQQALAQQQLAASAEEARSRQQQAQQQLAASAEEARSRQQQAQQQLAAQRQQQTFAQEQAATEQARAQQEFQLKSEVQARKYAAQQRYQQLISSGMDPAQALLQVAPDLGESLTGAAQLEREAHPFIPTSSNIGGIPMVSTSRGQWEVIKPNIPKSPSHMKLKDGSVIAINADGTIQQLSPPIDKPAPSPKMTSGPNGDTFSDTYEEVAKYKKQLKYQEQADAEMVASEKEKEAAQPSVFNLWNKFKKDAPVQPEQSKQKTKPVSNSEKSQIDTVNTQEEYDALPSGSIYTGEDGKKYRKP